MHHLLRPPPGYSVHPATPDDLSAVAGLLAACDTHDLGFVEFTESQIRSQWSNPDLDLSTDSCLVTATDETVVGLAVLFARVEHTNLVSWGSVHPDHRGRGLGSFLLDAVDQRAAEHRAAAPKDRAVEVTIEVLAVDSAVRRMLEAFGYHAARRFWRMDLDLEPGMGAPAPRDGIAIRPFAKGPDDRAVHEAMTEAFRGHWGSIDRTFDEWSAQRFGDPSFDPSVWFVAVDGDEMAGAVLGSVDGEAGWINTLGVRERWRGRGIGQALLGAVFAAFWRRGLHSAGLGVDSENETGATRLYERAGMHVTAEWVSFVKVLPAPA